MWAELGRRVYRGGQIALRVAEMVWFGLTMIPLRMRVGKFYGDAASAIVKDIKYGDRERNVLDVYSLPAGGHHELHPVVVFVHGGAWSFGDKSECCLGMDVVRRADGVLCVVPNYTLYPSGRVDIMVDDLVRVLRWVAEHAHEHGGDCSRVMFAGHSAGAHLAMLTTLMAARRDFALPPQLRVRCVVCVAGVFHIEEHYHHEASRGVEEISAMKPAMHGMENFDMWSPELLVGDLPAASVPLPPVVLVHGENDGTVPVRASQRFHEALLESGHVAEMDVWAGYGHVDIVLSAIEPNHARCLATELGAALTRHVRRME